MMTRKGLLLAIFILLLPICLVTSQSFVGDLSGIIKEIQVKAIVEKGDTLPVFQLPTIWVYPEMKFKNKREEKFYWRLVRDVKRTLPLSKYIKDIII